MIGWGISKIRLLCLTDTMILSQCLPTASCCCHRRTAATKRLATAITLALQGHAEMTEALLTSWLGRGAQIFSSTLLACRFVLQLWRQWLTILRA